jgi:hypothetical protein
MSTTMKHRARNRGVVAVGTLTAGLLLVLGTGSPAQASVVSTVGLGTADSYEILAGSTITNTGSTMINNGDVGLSPGSSVTGFPPAVINNGVIHAADAQAQQAQADLITAYNDAAGRTPAAAIVGDLGSQTLAPGVYKGGAVGLTGALTLSGDANSVWIFQAASTLITASASSVVFAAAGDSGTPGPCNVFWQVATSATIGSGSHFAGTVMALSSITVNDGATIDGRLLTRDQAATSISETINRPADCAARSAIVASTPTAEQAAAAQAAAAAAAAAARLAATGVNPTPGLVTAAALFLVGGVLLVESRFRRRRAGNPEGEFRKSRRLG